MSIENNQCCYKLEIKGVIKDPKYKGFFLVKVWRIYKNYTMDEILKISQDCSKDLLKQQYMKELVEKQQKNHNFDYDHNKVEEKEFYDNYISTLEILIIKEVNIIQQNKK